MSVLPSPSMRAVNELNMQRVADAASAELQMEQRQPRATTTYLLLAFRTMKVLIVVSLIAGGMYAISNAMGRVQLLMTSAGAMMVLLSVICGLQEAGRGDKSSTFEMDGLIEEEMGSCVAVKVPSKPAKASTMKQVRSAAESVLNRTIASNTRRQAKEKAVLPTVSSKIEAATVVTSPVSVELKAPISTAVRPDRSTRSSVPCAPKASVNKMVVIHCGTVIDIQGSNGLLIPHDFVFGTNISELFAHVRIPLAIPFDLSMIEEAVRGSVLVGQQVEFTYSKEPGTVPQSEIRALNVMPVASEGQKDETLTKSRNALQSCRQVREQSFARAMGELKMISPRNEPVKHQVDLIKYAAHLDDEGEEVPLDLFI